MSVLLAGLLALFLQFSGGGNPAEDDGIVSAMLGLSESALYDVCACDTEPVFEPYDDGTLFVGAIAQDTEVSAGFTFANNTVTFEVREP